MQILWWLVPAFVVTAGAMVWATWAGRPQPARVERSETAKLRFAEAIARPHPGAASSGPHPARDRSTGIAVRRSGSTRGPA